jgi:RNA polymerase sigma factor (sigma-70 family)
MEAHARRHRRSRGETALRLLTPRARREQEATERAFERFYEEHVAEVYRYALAVLANPTDAEDVTQQTFLNAYRAFQKGERPHTPHNWLIKIAHNVCRMRWRQASRRLQEVPLENAPEPARLDTDQPSVDDILSALARLPFNQRAAVVMREVEGRSYAEIANVLATTVPAVEALLFRARTNLKARRDALGVLTLVPVPPSLATFFGGGTAAMVGAGAGAVGLDVVLKGAAVVVAGLTLGGVGFKSVEAVAKPRAPRSAAVAVAASGVGKAAAWTPPAQRFLGASAADGTPGLVPHRRRVADGSSGGWVAPGADVGEAGSTAAAPGAAPTAAAGAAAAQGGSGTAAGTVGDVASTTRDAVGGVTDTVRKVVGAVPPAPPAPVPPAPLPPPPSLPVTTAVPTLSTPTLTTPAVPAPTLPTPTVP